MFVGCTRRVHLINNKHLNMDQSHWCFYQATRTVYSFQQTNQYRSDWLIFIVQTYQEDPEVDYGRPYSGPQLPVRRSCTGERKPTNEEMQQKKKKTNSEPQLLLLSPQYSINSFVCHKNIEKEMYIFRKSIWIIFLFINICNHCRIFFIPPQSL